MMLKNVKQEIKLADPLIWIKRALTPLTEKTIMNKHQVIIGPVLNSYPDTQAIYLFGSCHTENERPDSDIDIALLMPIETAKLVKLREWLDLSVAIMRAVGREKVDLINLRQVNTVFRKEIVMADRRIYCADEDAANEFEMLTLSLYQQLQIERKGIIEEIIRSGSVLHA